MPASHVVLVARALVEVVVVSHPLLASARASAERLLRHIRVHTLLLSDGDDSCRRRRRGIGWPAHGGGTGTGASYARSWTRG
eukprot:365747-Chlamydomonas_euryale.AAC.57